MGKIKDYTVEAAKALDEITCSDADTGATKNITVDGIAAALDLDSAWTTITVAISSAELLDISNTPIDILPTPDSITQYYEYRATMKYFYGTTPYTVSGNGELYLAQGDGPDCYFARLAINKAYDTFSFGAFYGHCIPGSPVALTSASNPTLGDGTVEIEITYKLKTF